MKHSLLLSFVLLLSTYTNAQPTPLGNLTVFSEDGDKFFLILNGERQNNEAQTNLRIEDLDQPYYNAKVVFEDKSLVDISKKYLAISDADGKYMDVTYKIKKDKKGTPKLTYFSMVPIQQGYIAPSNVTVIRHGNPQAETHTHNSQPATTTVVQKTTTTTVGALMKV